MADTTETRESDSGYEVLITDQGRSGGVEYHEGEIRVPLWWEFTLTGAWIWAPSPDAWDAYWQSNGVKGVTGRREEILTRVAAATVRQRATSARASVDEAGVTLEF